MSEQRYLFMWRVDTNATRHGVPYNGMFYTEEQAKKFAEDYPKATIRKVKVYQYDRNK